METLRIEFPFDKQEFIETQKIKSDFLWKDVTQKIRIIFTAAVILMTVGWIIHTDGEPFNVYLFIGGLFLLYGILLWQSKWMSQRRHTRHARLLAERDENIGMDCIYEFTDASLRYWDAEKHFDLKWSVFKNYSIYDEYLVLFVGETLVDLLMFRETESAKEEDEYHKILAFVKTKLAYKKT
jgi:hypothetical protein